MADLATSLSPSRFRSHDDELLQPRIVGDGPSDQRGVAFLIAHARPVGSARAKSANWIAASCHPPGRQIHTWLSRTASAIGSPRQVARLRWTQRTIAVLSYRRTSVSAVSIDR
jgi:hypothetical protein